MKKLLVGLLLSLSLFLPSASPVTAQVIPVECITIVKSMLAMAESRDEGMTKKEALDSYQAQIKERAPEMEGHPLTKRVIAKIHEVWALKDVKQETVDPAIKKELDTCLQVKGDYSKLVKS